MALGEEKRKAQDEDGKKCLHKLFDFHNDLQIKVLISFKTHNFDVCFLIYLSCDICFYRKERKVYYHQKDKAKKYSQ